MSSGEKTKSKSVSLAPDLWARVEAKAERKFGGNRSLYARQLFLADLDGHSAEDSADDGAKALIRFRELQPGNYSQRLQRAAAEGRPFAEIVDSLTDGDPKLMALARKAYDFLTRTSEGSDDAFAAAQMHEKLVLIAQTLGRTLNEVGARELLKMGKEGFPLAGEAAAGYGESKPGSVEAAIAAAKKTAPKNSSV